MAGVTQDIDLVINRAAAALAVTEANAVGKKTGAALEQGVGSSLSRLSSVLRGFAVGVIGAFSVEAIRRFGIASIRAADESERAYGRLGVALKNIGVDIKTVDADVTALGKRLLSRTTFDDEQATESLTTLVQITKDYKLSLEAVPIAADLAAAKHISLESATTLVGRALIGNVKALKLQGIELKDGAGLLQQLRDQFAGFAEQELTTVAGKTTQLRNEFNNLQEEIGKALLQAGGGTSVIDILTGAVQGLTTWVKANSVSLAQLGQVLTGGVITSVQLMGDAVGILVHILQGGALPAVSLFNETLGRTVDATAAFLHGIAAVNDAIGNDAFAARIRKQSDALHAYALELAATAKAQADAARTAQEAVGAGFRAALGRGNDVGPQTGANTGPATGVMAGQFRSDPIVGDRLVNLAKLEAAEAKAARAREKAAREAERDAARLARLQEAEIKREEELARARLDATHQLQASVAALTSTAVDDLEVALRQIQREIIQTFGAVPAEFQKALDAGHRLIENTKFLEGIDEQVTALDAKIATAGAAAMAAGFVLPAAQVVESFKAIEAALLKQLGTLDKGSTEYKKTLGILNEIRAKYDGIGEGLVEVETSTEGAEEKTSKWREKLESVADTIVNIAQGLLDFGNALGIIDQNTSKVLQGFVSLGRNIPEALSGKPDAIFGALAGAASIVGGLFGGDSAEERANRAAREHNSKVIEDLSRHIVALDKTISGKQLSDATRAAQEILAIPHFGESSFRGDKASVEATKVLEKFGLTMDDIREIAKAAGIEFVNTKEGWEQLTQALLNADFAGFAKTTEGQLEKMRFEWDLFDITDPIEQLKAYNATIQAQSGHVKVLEDLTKGLDLTTEAGQRELLKRTRQFYKDLEAGAIKATDLGGLSVEETKQFLLNSSNLLTDSLADFGDDVFSAAQAAAQKIDAAFNAASSRIDQRAAVFGLASEETFRLKFDLFKSNSAAAAREFAGLDIGTDAGARAIQAKIRKLFTEGSFGNLPVNPDDDIQGNAPPGPGQISQEEFLRGLVELQGSIDAIVAGREQKRVDDQNTRDRAREDASRSADDRQRARERAAQDRQRAAEDKLRETEARARARREAEEARVRALADTRGGLLTHLQDAIDVLHVDDAVVQLQELAKIFRDPAFAAPALKAALAGLDFTTPEGRTKAETALENLFRTIQKRNFTGVDDRVTVDAIRRLQDTLVRANEQATPAGTASGFTFSREVTTTQAAELSGSLRSSLLFAKQQTDYLRDIAGHTALLAALRAVGSDALVGRAVTLQLAPGAVNVTLDGAAIGADPERQGLVIGQAVMDQINRGLYAAFNRDAGLNGNRQIPL